MDLSLVLDIKLAIKEDSRLKALFRAGSEDSVYERMSVQEVLEMGMLFAKIDTYQRENSEEYEAALKQVEQS